MTPNAMDANTRRQLLDLNRSFYATVAEPFDQTRQGWPAGTLRLLDYLPQSAGEALAIADIGCGNGRFASMLESRQQPASYAGLDGDPHLLDLARRRSAGFRYVTTHFVQADLAQPDWPACVRTWQPAYDFVLCLATLQHLPGYELRLQVVRELAALLAPHGRLALSAWQFLSSQRLASKQIDWTQAGIDVEQVEPGDALLPWQRGTFAIRYVHQIDPDEMAQLATDAHLIELDSYRADGKEGNLNLYAILASQQS